ncbi:hypothetical protein B566_EDAN015730 [Ephemera danica]|nr:hypothetical protein B566_EDAN015730 [Ephemera danica]
MSSRVKSNEAILRILTRIKPSARKNVINELDEDAICSICEIAHNTLKGNVKLSLSQKQKLSRHRRVLRRLCQTGESWRVKKKKMLLVPSNSAERMAFSDDTKINPVSQIKSDVSAALENTALGDDEKWKSVSQLLIKLLKYAEINRTPFQNLGLKENDKVINDQKDDTDLDKKPDFSILIKDSVPKNLKSKAAGLYSILEPNSSISWDKKGRVSIEGSVIDGSNIVDLFNDILRSRKTKQPPGGWAQFSSFLAKNNIPQEYIGNELRRNLITQKDFKEEETAVPPRKKRSRKANNFITWESIDLS